MTHDASHVAVGAIAAASAFQHGVSGDYAEASEWSDLFGIATGLDPRAAAADSLVKRRGYLISAEAGGLS